jgi:hypothetical protein
MNLSEKRNMMLDAIVSKAQGMVDVHKANVEIYLSAPAGIGEHSCVVESLEKEIIEIAKHQEIIETIAKHYPKNTS